ncbi:MAG: hypothetical protein CBB71_16890 [Rhodopirellula sp. TMED11]|nr:MAG: hypothetical protein CBB71_16890 [Rhodopirellula sp. TMED11]
MAFKTRAVFRFQFPRAAWNLSQSPAFVYQAAASDNAPAVGGRALDLVARQTGGLSLKPLVDWWIAGVVYS